jgi:hypothetical protein
MVQKMIRKIATIQTSGNLKAIPTGNAMMARIREVFANFLAIRERNSVSWEFFIESLLRCQLSEAYK